MVPMEIVQATSRSIDQPNSSPRISFSSGEFFDEEDFISISPNRESEKSKEMESKKPRHVAEFEFLSSSLSTDSMLTADELFSDGKLLPFWQLQQEEKVLNKICLKTKENDQEGEEEDREEVRREKPRPVNWFIDDDPSPRPPNCTVLWKELLRLKKQRAASSSTSSLADNVNTEEGKQDGSGNREKHVMTRIKKGLERTRSASIRIRPMVNLPICTQVKSSALPPLFSLKKGRLES